MTEALVEVDRAVCGMGCGESAFVLLAKEGDRWEVRDYYGVIMA